jgi:hypothetical protein
MARPRRAVPPRHEVTGAPRRKVEETTSSLVAMTASELNRKVKTALDETRLLILGAQIFFGFQLHAVFQDAFAELSETTRLVACLGQLLMTISIGLLVTPSLQHQIVDRGEDKARILYAANFCAAVGLFPLSMSLGLSIYVVFDHALGRNFALLAGVVFCGLSVAFWYGLAFVFRRRKQGADSMPDEAPRTSLDTKVDQMLVEARVIIPGAQALLGFQFTVILTRSFSQLGETPRLIHIAALCCVALAIILLMTPAALHRIAFGGENTRSFLERGSGLIIVATVPLALGIAGDLYVAIGQASGSATAAAVLAVIMLGWLLAFWQLWPWLLRYRRAQQRS